MKHSTYILARRALADSLEELTGDYFYLKLIASQVEPLCDPANKESQYHFIKLNSIKTKRKSIQDKRNKLLLALKDLKKSQKEPLLKPYKSSLCSLLK